MTNDDMLEVFGGFDPRDHESEARERWGDTDAYRESARRTAGYTRQDWDQSGREADDINNAFRDLMTNGVDASDPAAAAVVDLHREHITKWYYTCTPEIHAGLGEMYVDDVRFTQNIDKAGTGLTRYIADTIAARYQS